MARLDRNNIKIYIVAPALKAIADFDGDFEHFTFEHFPDLSITLFANKLKVNLNGRGLDVMLNDQTIENWQTFKDSIDYLTEEHFEL